MTLFASTDHLINPELLSASFRAVREMQKVAFVPGGDPSMGGDPSQGGAPPPDPSQGGAPPPDAGGGGGGGGGGGDGLLMQQVQQLTQQMQQMQQQSMGGGAGAGGAGGKNPLAPKIDEKAVLSQILKLMARIVDHLKIPVPASEMVINTADQVALAQASQQGGAMPGIDPTAQAGGGMGGGAGQPMPGAGAPGGMPPPGPEKMGSDKKYNNAPQGFAFVSSGLVKNANRAASIARMLGVKPQAA